MNINYQNKTWEVIGVRTAEQVAAEHPDKRIGELMNENSFELLLLREVGYSTIELGIARIHRPSQQTVVFKDKHQNIIDPDSFCLE